MNAFGKRVGLVGCSLLAIMLGCRKDQPELSANSGPSGDQGRLPSIESTSAQGPARPGPTIMQVEPIDMATSVGTTPMQVIVSNWGAPVGLAQLKQIAAALSLKTWPEMADVPITVSNISDTTGQPGEDAYAHIYVAAASALPDRWYALTVGSLPSGVSWPPFPSMLPIANGANIARFRPGSTPVVAGVRTYNKAGGASVAYVDFSERVTGAVSALQLVYADGSATACVADDPAAATPTMNTSNAGVTSTKTAPQIGFTTVGFNCSTAIDIGRPIALSVGPGLSSTSGPPVYGALPTRLSIAPADWVAWAGGGQLWRGGP